MKFAVIDTETNWDNEVMSVGIVIAKDGQFDAFDSKYIIFVEAERVGGMYSPQLYLDEVEPECLTKKKAIKAIKDFLESHNVKILFAYNAPFDRRCLAELCDYDWRDILRLAAYKQHNPAIPKNAKCCSTGRLKSGYRVEDIMNILGERNYIETHNALTDAMDELHIMKCLGHSINKYPGL